jgi:hypothetical protein
MVKKKEPKLLEKVRDLIRVKHYSLRTEQTYLSWIKRFILFHNKRHPREMGEAEVGQFLTVEEGCVVRWMRVEICPCYRTCSIAV